MDPISISAASGMRARMESLEMLANNLANASTGGYKTDHEFYSLYVSQDAASGEAAGTDASPDQLPVVEKQYTDYSQGVIRATDSPLDFALSGNGFFAVDGPSKTLYTRNGNFRLTPTGLLTTQDGFPVRGKGGAPIQSKSSSSLEVGADGTVRQDGQALGQLEVAGFDAASQLSKQGMNYFYKTEAATVPSVSTAEVYQGKLETSNVGPAESAVRLVSIMRQFEMLQKAMLIGGDMNKQAIEEVAKV